MANTIQLNFSRGELTPLLQSRIDLDHYKAGLKVMHNWIATRFGGMTRMPGTIFYGEAKTAARTHRYLPFQFSRAQTYAIEAGHLYFRFWNIFGRVENPPGTPVEVVTPYVEADLKYIQVRQSGDLVFIFCRGYWPRVLTRTSEIVWGLANYVPLDGPYLDINTTATTLDPSAASGSVTITASAITGINGGTGFAASDVGRVIRFLEAGGRWFWFVITAFTSTTVVTATFMGRDDGDTAAMPGHAASANWRLGAWSAYDGYPTAVGLYEERLTSAGTTRQPTGVWGTVAQDTGLDDYSFQAPVVADDGFAVRLTGQLATVQWIADGKDIILGTEGGLRVLGRNDESAAFGPTNMRQKPETAVTAAYIPGFFIENVLVFLDVYRGVLYEALYANEAQGYVARELSALNEHLLGLGVTSIAYQVRPHKIIWMTTDSGLLLAATYDRDQEVFGVSQCDLGGDGLAEWVMSLPGTTKDGDQVWLAVHRTLAGVDMRTVEVMSAFYREGYSEQLFPIYGHCAGFYDDAAANTLTGLAYAEGETYGVWADGVDLGDVTIEDGELILPNDIEAEQIVWGLRYSSRACTLRLAEFGDGGPGLGRPSITGEVVVDVYQTPVLRVGAGELDSDDYDAGLDFWRWEGESEQDPYGAAELLTRAVPLAVDDSWENNGVLTIETNSMHPATVTAITASVEGADP
jgi:hypothetical protein